MDINYANTMGQGLVVAIYAATGVRIAPSSFRGNIEEMSKLARKYVNDSHISVKDAAAKLAHALGESVATDSSGKKIPASTTTSTANASPARNFTAEWSQFEKLALNEAGPMASRMVKKIIEMSPHTSPRSAKNKIIELMGDDVAKAIFSEYKGT